MFANKYMIECAVLNTILTSGYIQTSKKPFKIDEKHFTYSLNKTIAKRLREAFERDEDINTLEFKFYEWCEHSPTKRDQFQNIISQTALPMEVAKDYYEYLKVEKIKSEFSYAI